MEDGKLNAIWVKRMKRGPMDEAENAELVTGRGIVGNANQGGQRQVTIIEEEVWNRLMGDFTASLSPSTRRANLMVSGISLTDSRDHLLRIGDCQIRIRGETKPCERMDEALDGLREAMYEDWQGGAFGEITIGGVIKIGDRVWWDE